MAGELHVSHWTSDQEAANNQSTFNVHGAYEGPSQVICLIVTLSLVQNIPFTMTAIQTARISTKTCRGDQWLHVHPFESQLNAFGGRQLAAHTIFFYCVHRPIRTLLPSVASTQCPRFQALTVPHHPDWPLLLWFHLW